MMSEHDHGLQSDQDAERKRKTVQTNGSVTNADPVLESGAASLSNRQKAFLHTQQTLGNRAAIRRWKVQREDDPDGGADSTSDSSSASSGGSTPALNIDRNLALGEKVQVEPIGIALVPSPEPGDYPLPDPNADTVMAKRIEGGIAPGVRSRVQRDPPGGGSDDRPHVGQDIQYGYTFPIYLAPGTSAPAPWSYQRTFVYRNVNLWTGSSGRFTLDLFHEPNAGIGFDSLGGLSAQAAVTLINLHWMAPWRRELELGLSTFINTSILPQMGLSGGGQAQLEAHVLDSFSVTFSMAGTWAPPQSGQPGQFGVTNSVGALFHF